MRCDFRVAYWALVGLLLLAPRAVGQIRAGDLSMNLNGTVSSGYTGTYGNMIQSSHGLNFGGTGTLSGSFYDPNFLNFNFSPYYNQSRANSDFRSVVESSGFNFNSGIFDGSHFPGSISYARTYDSQGNFGIPGIANDTTYGNSDVFAIGWSEIVPDLPSLTVGFQTGNSEYSLFGTNQNGNTHFRGFNVHSGYRVAGFNLNAYYSNSIANLTLPEVFDGSLQNTKSNSDTNTEGFSVGHSLPWQGMFSTTFNRSDINSDYLGYKFNGTIDTFTSTVGFQPTNKFHVQASTSYTDNLSGTLYQSIIPTGTSPSAADTTDPIVGSPESSHAWDTIGSASYAFLPNLQTEFYGERRTQTYLGQAYGANTVGGGVTYGRVLLGGSFNGSVFTTYNTLDQSNANNLGVNTTVGYTHAFGAWSVGGNFSYAQNVQMLLVAYTTSFYSYSASIRRNLRSNLSWSATAGGSRTGLTALPGSTSDAQSYSTGISYSRWLAANGSYTRSNGQALRTGGGLIPAPIPPIIPEALLVLFGGRSYSFSVSSTPIRRLTVAAAFAHANLNTSDGTAYWSKTEQYYTMVQYQFRKMTFNGGYSRLLQGFSVTGTPPAVVSSYYAGVTRWFNIF